MLRHRFMCTHFIVWVTVKPETCQIGPKLCVFGFYIYLFYYYYYYLLVFHLFRYGSRNYLKKVL